MKQGATEKEKAGWNEERGVGITFNETRTVICEEINNFIFLVAAE